MEIAVLNFLATNKEPVAVVAALVVFLLYTFWGRKTPCKVCKYSTFLSQMTAARDSYIEDFKMKLRTSYVLLLQSYSYEEGIRVASKDIANLVMRNKETVFCAMYEGELFIRELAKANHIPEEGTEEFISYTKEKFIAYWNIVWSYLETHHNSFYLVPMLGWKEAFEAKNKDMYERWEDTFRVIKRISNGEYKVNDRRK